MLPRPERLILYSLRVKNVFRKHNVLLFTQTSIGNHGAVAYHRMQPDQFRSFGQQSAGFPVGTFYRAAKSGHSNRETMKRLYPPSAEERQKEERTAGLNETVPQATDDKLKGYELGRDEEKESHRQETLGNLYDYFEKRDETREQELSEEAASDGLHPIERSVSRYEETSQMVHSFYEPPAYDYEKEALREELDMIRSELATLKEEKEEEIDHLELLEKSYRMAAKYFPASGDANSRDAYTRSQERPADAPAPKTAATAQRTALPAMELLPENLPGNE